MGASNEVYVERLVKTLMQQTKAHFREQFTGLGGGAYSEFFWKSLQGMNYATLGKIVACADEKDLKRSNSYQGGFATTGPALLMKVAHAVLYRRYAETVFGVGNVV